MEKLKERVNRIKTNPKIRVKVAFSGGKDSLASLILAIKKWGKDSIDVVFCDTGWEHPMTYKYIAEIMDFFGLEIKVLSSKKYDGFIDMVKKKSRFPSSKARFCTTELKSKPMIDYILDECQHVIIIQGIRKDESNSRSLMSKQCQFFKYYFEPYDSNEIRINSIESRLIEGKPITTIQQQKLEKAKKRLLEGFKDEKFHDYRKQDVIKFCSKWMDDVERPVFDMTAHEVIQIAIDYGVKLNPLYYLGMGRVGCFPCIMVGQYEFWQIIQKEAWVINDLRMYENDCGSSFFPPNYIPERYCSGRHINKKGETKVFPLVDDVVKYLKDKHSQGNLFPDEHDESRNCMSFYGICE